MMERDLFERTVSTLHTYAEIYGNLTNGAFDRTELTELEDLIADIISHLATNAKGQIL